MCEMAEQRQEWRMVRAQLNWEGIFVGGKFGSWWSEVMLVIIKVKY